MADRGFTIKEDLMVRGATLEIPPPSSGLEQMSKDKVIVTKKPGFLFLLFKSISLVNFLCYF